MSPAFLNIIDGLRARKDRLAAAESARTGDDFFPYETFFPCETEESLAVVEQSTGMPVPPELKEILLTLGGFSIRINVDGFALTFRSRSPFPHPFGGLADLLHSRWCWGDYRDEDDFPEEAIARMNAHFVCFGHCEVDENSADHFFYDRDGRFGVLHFDQDFRDQDAIDYLFELSEGKNNRAPMTLEEVLVPYLKEL